MTTALSPTRLTPEAATELTERIRAAHDQLWALLVEAYEGRAWESLGYASMTAYAAAEFGRSKGQTYRLLAQGRFVAALGSGEATDSGGRARATLAGATTPPISARQAAVLAPVMDEAVAEIRELVADGVPEKVAVSTVVAAHQRPKQSGAAQSGGPPRHNPPAAAPGPSSAGEVGSARPPERRSSQASSADLTEQAVIVWLQRRSDQEVRAIGPPFRPAWETEIRRWAGLLGVGPQQRPSPRHDAPSPATAHPVPRERREVEPRFKTAAKR